jgi:PAS domain S-box-containing protein
MNKLEQTKLADAQERFKGIFESSKDAIGYATLEDKLVDVNEGYTRLLGPSREEILALRYQDYTPGEYASSQSRGRTTNARNGRACRL